MAIIVLLLGSTACSSRPGGLRADDGTPHYSAGPLRVLVNANNQYPAQQRDWFARIQQRFKQRTGAEVQFETYVTSSDEQKKIQTSVVAGDGPDVYSLGTTFTPVAYATKAFLEMGPDEWKAIGGRERFTGATLAMSGPDPAHQIGIPFVSRPFVMAYNKKLFAQAGIASPPTTWDQLVADGKLLTKGDTFGMAVAYADNYDPWKFAWMFANQYGNPLIDGKKARLDDPSVQRAYDAYFGFLTRDKIVNPEAVGWQAPQSLAAFASGKAAMVMMVGPGAMPTLSTSPVKDDFAFAKMPAVPPGETALPAGGQPATTIVSGDNIAIASYTKSKDLALAYVELVTSSVEQVNYGNTFGDVPANNEAATIFTGASQQLSTILVAGTAALPTPFTGAWSDVQLALTKVAADSRGELAAGGVPDASLTGRLAEAQKAAQSAVDRAAGS